MRQKVVAGKGGVYLDWIFKNYPKPEDGYGKCKEAAEKMVAEFAELRIAKGHVETGAWGRRGHWWCVMKDGTIVDPTANQFPGVFEYDEWTPGKGVDVGPCANCGEEITVYPKSLDEVSRPTCCSDACHKEYARYVMGEI